MSLSSYFNALFNGQNILLVTKTVTIASMGIAAGAGLSYNAMIMPAVQKFSPMNALAVWCECAFPAMLIQITAIATSVIGGTIVYYKTKNRSFLYGAMIMASVLPYTGVMFFPINSELFRMNKSGIDDGTVWEKMQQWNRNQYGRVLLNVAAMVVTLFGGLQGKTKTV
ncbi:hypothetical protein BC939DRAFT_506449 [Gamsiella multidivaricata]|uniref:uncharacterized protein n=1 Tax=Gamsiella multidivaricata TaxID=101098 RepID=UPI00221E508E|nr:uncharacterized protein BC939DRAFT_506449 [Gamsiella multidivaricata]KAG0350769.1 hypothetical protein BGZ54_003647 [Gamsiella multidivaricata]KAI7818594.1 hypothetical protein BC939DRAFT_506449 [Gamsiella multidivaricata]